MKDQWSLLLQSENQLELNESEQDLWIFIMLWFFSFRFGV